LRVILQFFLSHHIEYACVYVSMCTLVELKFKIFLIGILYTLIFYVSFYLFFQYNLLLLQYNYIPSIVISSTTSYSSTQTDMLKKATVNLSDFIDSVLVRLKAIEVLSESNAVMTGVESQKEAIQAALNSKNQTNC
jgi:hypothetical protein